MNKKLIAFLLPVLIIIAGGFYWLTSASIDKSLISEELKISRVIVAGEKTESASISLGFNKDSNKYEYANVAIDFNKDGQFESYKTNDKTQEEWVVKNIPSRVLKEEGSSFSFELADKDVDSKKGLNTKIIFTKEGLAVWDGKAVKNSAFKSANVGSITIEDTSSLYSPDPDYLRDGAPSSGSPPELSSDIRKELEEATKAQLQKNLNPLTNTPSSTPKEKTISTLGKEFDVFHGDVPDTLQKENECVPTSAANSLLWLAKKNNFIDKMPKSDAELISELKTDFKWEKGGVSVDDDFLTGKEAFVNRHKIPIVTHKVSPKDYDENIVAKIATELQKGQDVEIQIKYFRKKASGEWEITGGHMVTVVGARGYRDGKQILEVHDPLSPGPSKLDIYQVNGSNIVNYRYGPKLTYIKAAFAESPIEPPAIPLDDASKSDDKSKPNITTPTFHGQYEVGNEGNLFYVNLMITPTNLADKTFSGMEIDLGAQSTALPQAINCSANVNLAGWGKSDWKSSKKGLVHRWSGTTAMQKDTKSLLTLYFDKSVTLPETINMSVLDSGGNPTIVSLTK